MYEDYIDMLNRTCLNCGKGTYKRTPLLLYEFQDVICDTCAYRDERFKVKENYNAKQEAN